MDLQSHKTTVKQTPSTETAINTQISAVKPRNLELSANDFVVYQTLTQAIPTDPITTHDLVLDHNRPTTAHFLFVSCLFGIR